MLDCKWWKRGQPEMHNRICIKNRTVVCRNHRKIPKLIAKICQTVPKQPADAVHAAAVTGQTEGAKKVVIDIACFKKKITPSPLTFL